MCVCKRSSTARSSIRLGWDHMVSEASAERFVLGTFEQEIKADGLPIKFLMVSQVCPLRVCKGSAYASCSMHGCICMRVRACCMICTLQHARTHMHA